MMYDKLIVDKQLLEKQLFWLEISFQECFQIGLKKEYTVEEFGKFEILCARYSRSIDFLIRKMFRTIDAYEFENQGTLVDVVNNAHKRGLFEDIQELRIIKNTLIYITKQQLTHLKQLKVAAEFDNPEMEGYS